MFTVSHKQRYSVVIKLHIFPIDGILILQLKTDQMLKNCEIIQKPNVHVLLVSTTLPEVDNLQKSNS